MSKTTHKKTDIIGKKMPQIHETNASLLSPDDERRLRSIFSDFASGFNLMIDKGPAVTVFGSSRITSDKPEYKLGVELGRALSKMGFTVLTGGGPGLMEAVNKGAHENNGRSIGINIDLPEEQPQNAYTSMSITINHFFVRKVLLLKYSSVFIFMPGGFGTLDEFFETITLIQTRKIETFPMILIGRDFWKGLMSWIEERLLKDGLITKGDAEYFYFADTVEEAIGIIKKKLDDGTVHIKHEK
jgi:uncharacterized protein (TIGR00730 family)